VTVEVDADTDYEPDAVVNYGPKVPPDATAATNPVIVVEVLSPTTQSIDTGEKLEVSRASDGTAKASRTMNFVSRGNGCARKPIRSRAARPRSS